MFALLGVGQFENHFGPESHLRLSSLARVWRGGSVFCGYREKADPPLRIEMVDTTRAGLRREG
jgi:hypothetical protein